MRVAVAQVGARRHYLVPRALERAGMLEHLYTDIYGTPGLSRLLRTLPQGLRLDAMVRLMDRVPEGIDPGRISTFTRFAFEYKWRCRMAKDISGRTAAWLWGGRQFCGLVLQRGLHGADAVYTFNSVGLELLRAAREMGLAGVLDQTMAPRDVERRILQEERQRWPGWEQEPEKDRYLDEYCDREREEWKSADLIVCGSEFVKQAIAGCNGPVERCVVMPSAADIVFKPEERVPHDGPLHVLFAGTVGLRKGAPYVLETAKQTKGVATYRMVGPIDVTRVAAASLGGHVELIGPVPRSRMVEHYRWADVVVLPSLCEGSANVIQEALATGLPVICTPNSGALVCDGIDGYLVPVRSIEYICERIELLYRNPALLREMSRNASARMTQISVWERYGRPLTDLIASLN